MLIRPETVADYAAIARIHARAFGQRAAEAVIVALLRQRRAFDPELALVAELDGEIVGHILFSPYQMNLLGQTLPAVNLAPVAVDPLHQNQGIGSHLIREGHAIAAAKGYRVSVLLGHTAYYPRFGYQTSAFAHTQVLATPAALPHLSLATRNPSDDDLPALHNLWHLEEGAVDLALQIGPDLLDWLSPNPAIQVCVYLHENEVVGYTRIHTDDLRQPRVFLARDGATARAMVALLAQQQVSESDQGPFTLPLHPASASAATFGQATCDLIPAGMVCELGPSPLAAYMAAVQAGSHPPGRIIWPVAFDLA